MPSQIEIDRVKENLKNAPEFYLNATQLAKIQLPAELFELMQKVAEELAGKEEGKYIFQEIDVHGGAVRNSIISQLSPELQILQYQRQLTAGLQHLAKARWKFNLISDKVAKLTAQLKQAKFPLDNEGEYHEIENLIQSLKNLTIDPLSINASQAFDNLVYNFVNLFAEPEKNFPVIDFENSDTEFTTPIPPEILDLVCLKFPTLKKKIDNLYLLEIKLPNNTSYFIEISSIYSKECKTADEMRIISAYSRDFDINSFFLNVDLANKKLSPKVFDSFNAIQNIRKLEINTVVKASEAFGQKLIESGAGIDVINQQLVRVLRLFYFAKYFADKGLFFACSLDLQTELSSVSNYFGRVQDDTKLARQLTKIILLKNGHHVIRALADVGIMQKLFLNYDEFKDDILQMLILLGFKKDKKGIVPEETFLYILWPIFYKKYNELINQGKSPGAASKAAETFLTNSTKIIIYEKTWKFIFEIFGICQDKKFNDIPSQFDMLSFEVNWKLRKDQSEKRKNNKFTPPKVSKPVAIKVTQVENSQLLPEVPATDKTHQADLTPSNASRLNPADPSIDLISSTQQLNTIDAIKDIKPIAVASGSKQKKSKKTTKAKSNFSEAIKSVTETSGDPHFFKAVVKSNTGRSGQGQVALPEVTIAENQLSHMEKQNTDVKGKSKTKLKSSSKKGPQFYQPPQALAAIATPEGSDNAKELNKLKQKLANCQREINRKQQTRVEKYPLFIQALMQNYPDNITFYKELLASARFENLAMGFGMATAVSLGMLVTSILPNYLIHEHNDFKEMDLIYPAIVFVTVFTLAVMVGANNNFGEINRLIKKEQQQRVLEEKPLRDIEKQIEILNQDAPSLNHDHTLSQITL